MSKSKYRANWALHGLTEKPLKEGDIVALTEEEAAPYIGGVLSPANESAKGGASDPSTGDLGTGSDDEAASRRLVDPKGAGASGQSDPPKGKGKGKKKGAADQGGTTE